MKSDGFFDDVGVDKCQCSHFSTSFQLYAVEQIRSVFGDN